MVAPLETLAQIAERFGAIVLDQWGVLHNGTQAYPGAIAALEALKARGTRLAVLSNSGKRAAPNAARIAAMGFQPSLFEAVMTSGEALWQDIHNGHIPVRQLYAVESSPGDAADWAQGLSIGFVDQPDAADALLLMGLPDGVAASDYADILAMAVARNMPIYCTNPDRASPRAGGVTVVSPGVLAYAAVDQGAQVVFYGKPHRPIFRALETQLNLPSRALLMVGDSLEHDIAGGAEAGWSTAFIRGGLHAKAFSNGAPIEDTLRQLAQADAAPMPTYTLSELE
ncbi:MAG: TIGR01459 family HAD-type hydrolase [Pseudomonadota bacterium]